MRWSLYNGFLPQGFKNLHYKTNSIKNFLNNSDEPQINVLAGALLYLWLLLV